MDNAVLGGLSCRVMVVAASTGYPPARPCSEVWSDSGSLLLLQRRRALRSLASTSRVRVIAAPIRRGALWLHPLGRCALCFHSLGQMVIFIGVRPAGPANLGYLCHANVESESESEFTAPCLGLP